jgi:light-regulated signal transduction histidine kinase (bacteriophytochrome)
MGLDPKSSSEVSERLNTVERELRDDFSYIVSHDLVAAFRHVAQFSNLLVQGLDQNLTERQQAYANYIQAATEKCQDMMDKLLAFSRIQQKDLKLDLFDPTRSARMAMLQLSAEIQRAGANISIEPLGTVRADPDLLTLAFCHLLENAVKFRKFGASPIIRIEPAHYPGRWAARIIDNGIGVPIEHQEKLFSMFTKWHADETYGGVDAGLAICRRIARRLGGDVQFLDWPDGACVELTLPLAVCVS